ncbi:hypothetical protein [Brumimicrobium aurantiacum]|uniref:hypothetical protein n=1 Tax=Brumimicrobium aurantiacum TaxID=1737063 RepID=UPI000F4FDB66|nr:hypothetical protein [Brumimicrobium aurantiacum]
MKTITHPYFIVSALIYLVYYGLKQTDIQLPIFISNYLADLLSVFLVNTFVLWCIRKVQKRPEYELSTSMVFLSVVLFSVFFEIYLPNQNTKHVADVWDILCYLISGISYVLWRKRYF